MQERPKNLSAAGEVPEATLVTPRFDAEEASRAHPVVPLVEAGQRAPYANPSASARRGLPRSWVPALLAVALLAAVAVGGAVASKLLRRAQPNPAAAVAPARADDIPAQTEQPPAEAAAAPREVADTKPEARAARVTGERRAEDATAPVRVEAVRADAEDFGDDEDDDRGRRVKGRKKQRERAEGDGGKEIGRSIKHAKGKAPRLVDVLVNPRP